MQTKLHYNNFAEYIKKKYGKRVQKITVNAGFTCPNRDGTISQDGCTFCNNHGFSSVSQNNLPLQLQIQNGILKAKKRYNTNLFFIYFQPFSNTHGSVDYLEKVYREALAHPEVIGLCIGTRPDCINKDKLDLLEELAKTHEIILEYGLESISDETLKKVNRGHDFNCFNNTISDTAKRKLSICAHLIFGFPWESDAIGIQTAKIISNLPINFIKIHQLQIVQGTSLADEYSKQPFPLLSMEQYISTVTDFLEYLNPQIIIQRLAGETLKDLLIAPLWKSSLSSLSHQINQELIKRSSYQGKWHKL